MSKKISKELKTAIDAANKAGKILIKYFNRKKVSHNKKHDNSFVSEADLAAEKIILKTLTTSFPKYAFYSEEKGASKNKSDYCWYIDPLDGTHNFLHKLPMFGTSIALSKNGRFILGVIYFPITKELFYAEKGKGSFLNGKKISVSEKKLNEAMLCLPTSSNSYKHQVLKLISIFEPLCAESRMTGSCSFGLCCVASGRYDFHIKRIITPHDVGAGKVIIEEAGGRLTTIYGKEFTTSSNSFIASNNVFHNDIIKLLKKEGFSR